MSILDYFKNITPSTEKKLIAFTDGACINNGKKNAKAGCILSKSEHPSISISLNGKQTNSLRAELMGIKIA